MDYTLEVGEVLILPAGAPHVYGVSDRKPWSIHWVHFTGLEGDSFAEMPPEPTHKLAVAAHGRPLSDRRLPATAGGKGTIFGAFLAVIMVGVLNNGMNLRGFNTFVQRDALGLLLIAAVAISQWRQARAERARTRSAAAE